LLPGMIGPLCLSLRGWESASVLVVRLAEVAAGAEMRVCCGHFFRIRQHQDLPRLFPSPLSQIDHHSPSKDRAIPRVLIRTTRRQGYLARISRTTSHSDSQQTAQRQHEDGRGFRSDARRTVETEHRSLRLLAAHNESLMLSSCRRVDRTGVGHTCWVGRLLLGHTVRQERGGWGSTGHYQDNAGEHVSRFVGSDPLPRFQIMWGSCLKVWRAT